MVHSLQRRLAALERHQNAGRGMYAVATGDGYVDWHGQRVPFVEWQRRYPESVMVDISGAGDGSQLVKRLGSVRIDEL